MATRRGGHALTTGLTRINQVATEQPNARFTALMHWLNAELLQACHQRLPAHRAVGVDGVAREDYEEHLTARLNALVSRLQQHAYRPQPVRRVYIPKPGSAKQRPLGIPAYEDKLVQSAVSAILTAIYEADFCDFSFGFRPQRGAHDALKLLNALIMTRKVNYVVDADIHGFFDHVDHEWIMRFLRHRIADERLLRLIQRFLKAGIWEQGEWTVSAEGAPQGGNLSPILANVYLHYTLDLWFEKVVRPRCRGEAYLIRYADDFVACFQHADDADRFYAALGPRLAKFSLALAEEKTQVLPFGRFGDTLSRAAGQAKPGTFDFVGFTHYGGRSRDGRYRLKRRTSRKKFTASLHRVTEWVRTHRTLPIAELMAALNQKLVGYYHYYGITDNRPRLDAFLAQVRRVLFKWLNRRSQRASFDGAGFEQFLRHYPLTPPRIWVNIQDLRHPSRYLTNAVPGSRVR